MTDLYHLYLVCAVFGLSNLKDRDEFFPYTYVVFYEQLVKLIKTFKLDGKTSRREVKMRNFTVLIHRLSIILTTSQVIMYLNPVLGIKIQC